jgi:TonB-dependent starch-binding outer membrane protein SusC
MIQQNLPPSVSTRAKTFKHTFIRCFLLSAMVSIICSNPLLAQQTTITGKVTGENNDALPGVTVLIKGTTNGTATDANGNYSLTAPEANGTLVVSFVGYVTQEQAINSRTVINVSLVPDAKALQEVVVVGYGTQRSGPGACFYG